MNLSDHINAVGIAEFARSFGVPYHTAYDWAQGRKTPRPEYVNRLVAETPVTYAGIYNAEPDPGRSAA